MQCFKCGTHIGDMQIHDDWQCRQQQKINEENKRGHSVIIAPCPWCGSKLSQHDKRCPNGN